MLTDAATALLRLLPAETAHRATIGVLKIATPFLRQPETEDARLAISALGLRFPNPLGLAAGFDKNAEVPDAMHRLGFGFVECGSLTPRPQAGNPRPRLFRLADDEAVVNRMGFNNDGMERAVARLIRRTQTGMLGINIGANKDSTDRIGDYGAAFTRLAPFANYVAVNVSSPNTPGLRGLQNRDELARLLALLVDARAKKGWKTPLLLKIAPDITLDALDDIVATALSSGIEGLIVSNTTVDRPPSLQSGNTRQTGGLSGAPLFALSTELLRQTRLRTGAKLVLMGVGGVGSAADAYAKIRAGASLVQLYTALVYRGPTLVGRIKRELLGLLLRDGFANIAEAIGADVF